MQKPLSARQKRLFGVLLLAVITLGAYFVIKNGSQKEPIDCPLTDLGWHTTEQELFDAEGDFTSSYDSTYGGLTYTYDKAYLGRDGIIKYMFDGEGVLMSIAWTYSSPDAEELSAVYQEIKNGVQTLYGESEYHTANQTNYGDVWKKDEGHIILSAMTLDSNTALQIAYVNPAGTE